MKNSIKLVALLGLLAIAGQAYANTAPASTAHAHKHKAKHAHVKRAHKVAK